MEYIEYIQNNNFLLSSVINLIDDLIFYKDKNFKYIGCNKAFLTFIGKSPEDLIGKDDYEIFSRELADSFRHHDKLMLLEGKTRTNEEWVTYPNGEEACLLTKKTPFYYDEENTGILGISRDITSLERAKEKLKEQTLLDELTNIHNRKAYNLKIKTLLAAFNRYQTPFYIISMDIDDFKKINDNFGHSAGDTTLQRFSQLIKSQIRETDHFFRTGGEEFVLLTEAEEKIDAIKLAEKLRLTVAKKNLLPKVQITISLGICMVKQGDCANSIAKRVDALLYKAKSAGKNVVIHCDEQQPLKDVALTE